MVNSPVMKFILNNFDLNDYERQELRCKGHIKNKWGELVLPDGTTINPKELQIARIMHECEDMCCREPIDEHIFSAFYVVLHEGELYYLDVDEVIFLRGDMWDYGNNTNRYETWNSYVVPNMNTCNHHLYPLKYDDYAAFTWFHDKERQYILVKEACEKGYLENMM